MTNFFQPILIPILTFGIFIFTRNEITGVFKLQITLFLLITFVIYSYTLTKRGEILTADKRFIYLFISTILFLVGSTGWFFSPFFFILYLSAILLSFVFDLKSSFSFVLTLVLLFSFNIGEVDLAYDFLVVLSLLTTIPLSLYLRKEYLRLREAQNEILILEKKKENFVNKVEQVLANKINHIAVGLRQPINDIKLMAYHLKNLNKKDEVEKHRQRIIVSSEEALRLLKEFQEETTGKKFGSK